jgi:dihydrofolate synthase/folylpolyglutamate synthase
MLSYHDALAYIYSFTDYEKQYVYRYAPETFDLNRMVRLLDYLDNPHLRFRVVHIAGTKGKGSTSAMIASVLQAAGYRTGLYTSPHLHTFRERIQINDHLIGETELCTLVEQIQSPVADVPELTTFEIITALGFLYFAQQQIDWAILEVGMGGRLDATNVITPQVAVITSLSYDHTDILGHTLAAIAQEKAGIIKPHIPVVTAPQPAEAMAVIEEVCAQQGAPLTVVGRDWQWEAVSASPDGQSFYAWSARNTGQAAPRHLYWIPLAGPHQLINATCSLAAVNLLWKQGVDLSQVAILAGLRDMRWPGRLEVLGREPWVVVDGAHNGDSARKLVAAIGGLFPHRRLVLVFGALMGHSVPDMLDALLPVADRVILTRSNRARAIVTSDLLQEVHSRCREAEVTERVAEALVQALDLASPEDLICATGSLSVAAEMREAWAARQGLSLPPCDP